MPRGETIKIRLTMQRRRDGGLRIWSDDVPGLVLSNSDPAKVLADVAPALEVIVSEMVGYPVQAGPLTPIAQMLHAPVRRRRGVFTKLIDAFTVLFPRKDELEFAAARHPA